MTVEQQRHVEAKKRATFGKVAMEEAVVIAQFPVFIVTACLAPQLAMKEPCGLEQRDLAKAFKV